MLVGWSPAAWGASGSISIDGPTSLEVSPNSIISISGKAQVSNDTTGSPDSTLIGFLNMAEVDYEIDGVNSGSALVFFRYCWFSDPCTSNLDTENAIGALISTDGFDVGTTHTVRFFIKDLPGTAELASQTVRFKIVKPRSPDLDQCYLSTVNMASGNLSHSQDLFSVKGSVLPPAVTLYYNSLESFPGAISTGWNHSYELALANGANGVKVLREPDGGRRLYTISGSTYVSQPGDTSTLLKNADSSYTITFSNNLKYNFDSNGRLISIIDRYANALTCSYNTAGDLTTVIDSFNRGISFGYDTSHHLTTVTDPNQNAYTLAYDTNNRLQKVVYPVTDAGVSAAYWEYTYNSDGRILTKREPSGNTITYTYTGEKVASAVDSDSKRKGVAYPARSDSSKVSSLTNEDGGVWQTKYDPATALVSEKTAPDGTKTNYYYNADRTMKAKTVPGQNGIRYTTFYSYDGSGNTLTESIPLDCTALGIDPATIAVSDTRLKVAWRYSYDNENRILSQSDERGATPLTTTTSYSTDAEGYLVTTVTTPAAAVTVTRQLPDGRIKESIDANQYGKTTPLKTTYTYRTDGQLNTITSPAGTVTAFTGYDPNGNNTEQQIKDSDGTLRKTIIMKYDALNRLRSGTIRVIGQPDIVTSYDYDASGNRTSVTDPENNTTRYEYNFNHQVTKVIDTTDKNTYFTYGATGCPSCGGGTDKLTALTDAKNQTTSYTYDQMGRLLTETDPMGKKFRYSYYENGKLKEKYDASSTPEILLITYTYDANGLLTGKQYKDGSSETYTYDANGRIATAANNAISYAYDYYPNGRPKSVTDSNNRGVSYDQYDNLGQKKQVTIKDGADQRTITYTYDETNRPQTITSSAGTFTYVYDELGRRDSITYPNGIIADYHYDDLGRLASLTHVAGTTIIAFTDYDDFDKNGNRKIKTTDKGTETYTYDNLYRLTSALTPKGTETYTYDDVGNRLSGPGATDTAYVYDNANRMTHGRLFGYDYDNAGNQAARTISGAADKSWTQTWDLENQLTKIEKSKGAEKRTITFKYDPFGRRIEKKLTTVINGVSKTSTWTFVYDNDNIALEIYSTDSTAPEKTWYTHGPSTDEHLALERNGTTYYYHADGLGSIISITGANKNIVQSYGYDSFGNTKQATGFRNSYAYTGREYDQEAQLYYYRARYYDPMEGRFVSKDPIGFDGGINVYAYVQNNPANYSDPFGLHHFSSPPPGTPCVTQCHPSEQKPLIKCTAKGSCKSPCWKISFKPSGEITFIEVTSSGEIKFKLEVSGSVEATVGPCSFKITCTFPP